MVAVALMTLISLVPVIGRTLTVALTSVALATFAPEMFRAVSYTFRLVFPYPLRPL